MGRDLLQVTGLPLMPKGLYLGLRRAAGSPSAPRSTSTSTTPQASTLEQHIAMVAKRLEASGRVYIDVGHGIPPPSLSNSERSQSGLYYNVTNTIAGAEAIVLNNLDRPGPLLVHHGRRQRYLPNLHRPTPRPRLAHFSPSASPGPAACRSLSRAQ